MQHKVRKLLLDIQLSCKEISEFTEGLSYEDFLEDRKLQLAIERTFEILGEAPARLERIDAKELETKIPEYRQIIGFRNLLAHGYDVIDQASLWDFAKNRVPELQDKIENY